MAYGFVPYAPNSPIQMAGYNDSITAFGLPRNLANVYKKMQTLTSQRPDTSHPNGGLSVSLGGLATTYKNNISLSSSQLPSPPYTTGSNISLGSSFNTAQAGHVYVKVLGGITDPVYGTWIKSTNVSVYLDYNFFNTLSGSINANVTLLSSTYTPIVSTAAPSIIPSQQPWILSFSENVNAWGGSIYVKPRIANYTYSVSWNVSKAGIAERTFTLSSNGNVINL